MSVVLGPTHSTSLGRWKMGLIRVWRWEKGLEWERKVTGRDWKEIEIMFRWLGRKSWWGLGVGLIRSLWVRRPGWACWWSFHRDRSSISVLLWPERNFLSWRWRCERDLWMEWILLRLVFACGNWPQRQGFPSWRPKRFGSFLGDPSPCIFRWVGCWSRDLHSVFLQFIGYLSGKQLIVGLLPLWRGRYFYGRISDFRITTN